MHDKAKKDIRYFRFFPDCQFIVGPARSTMYAIFVDRTYHLSKQQSEIANALSGDNSVEEVVNRYGLAAEELVDRFIKEGCGALHAQPVFSEPYCPTSSYELRGLLESPPVIKGVYLQLSDACDANCGFCSSNELHKWQGCNSCIRWPRGGGRERLTLENLDTTIDDLITFGVSNVIFSGGDPLMEWDTLVAISRRLKTANPRVTLKVNTNGQYVDEAVAQTAKELDIVFIFSLIGTNEEEYQVTAGVPDMYACLNRAILRCKEYGIRYDIAIVISTALRDNYIKMRECAAALGGKNMFATELISKHGKKDTMVSVPARERRVEDVCAQEFFQRQKYNYCLNGTIAIASDGSIMPCPVWPIAIGNIHAPGGLRQPFRTHEINRYWEMTKDTVPVCRDCENRYACVDCSILEWAARTDSSADEHFCPYSPELGEWRS